MSVLGTAVVALPTGGVLVDALMDVGLEGLAHPAVSSTSIEPRPIQRQRVTFNGTTVDPGAPYRLTPGSGIPNSNRTRARNRRRRMAKSPPGSAR